MANYKSKPQVYGEFIAPYDMKLLANAIQLKQQKYDANKAKIDAEIQNLTGLDLLKDSDRDYLQGRLSDLISAVNKGQGVVDFSSNATTEYINRYIGNAVDDTVLTAFQSTSTIRKNREMIDELKRKGSDKYGVSNEHYFNSFVQNYISNDQVGQSFRAQYIPHFDLQKYQKEQAEFLIKNMGEDIVEYVDPNNPWARIKKKVKDMSFSEINSYVSSNLPQEAKTQFMIDGHYRYRNNNSALEYDYQSALNSEIKQLEANELSVLSKIKTTGDKDEKEKYENIARNIKEQIDYNRNLLQDKNISRNTKFTFLEQKRYKDGLNAAIGASFYTQETIDVNSVYKAQMEDKRALAKINADLSVKMAKIGTNSNNTSNNASNKGGGTYTHIVSGQDSPDSKINTEDYINQEKGKLLRSVNMVYNNILSGAGKDLEGEKKSQAESDFIRIYGDEYKKQVASNPYFDKDEAYLKAKTLLSLDEKGKYNIPNQVKNNLINKVNDSVRFLRAQQEIYDLRQGAYKQVVYKKIAEESDDWFLDMKVPSFEGGVLTEKSLDNILKGLNPIVSDSDAKVIQRYNDVSNKSKVAYIEKQLHNEKEGGVFDRVRWEVDALYSSTIKPFVNKVTGLKGASVRGGHITEDISYSLDKKHLSDLDSALESFNSNYNQNLSIDSLGLKETEQSISLNPRGYIAEYFVNSLSGKSASDTDLASTVRRAAKVVEAVSEPAQEETYRKYNLDRKGLRRIDLGSDVQKDIDGAMGVISTALAPGSNSSAHHADDSNEGISWVKTKSTSPPKHVVISGDKDFVRFHLTNAEKKYFGSIKISMENALKNIDNFSKEAQDYILDLQENGNVIRNFYTEVQANQDTYQDNFADDTQKYTYLQALSPEQQHFYKDKLSKEEMYNYIDSNITYNLGTQQNGKPLINPINGFLKHLVKNGGIDMSYSPEQSSIVDEQGVDIVYTNNKRTYSIGGRKASEVIQGEFNVKDLVSEANLVGRQAIVHKAMTELSQVSLNYVDNGWIIEPGNDDNSNSSVRLFFVNLLKDYLVTSAKYGEENALELIKNSSSNK